MDGNNMCVRVMGAGCCRDPALTVIGADLPRHIFWTVGNSWMENSNTLKKI